MRTGTCPRSLSPCEASAARERRGQREFVLVSLTEVGGAPDRSEYLLALDDGLAALASSWDCASSAFEPSGSE